MNLLLTSSGITNKTIHHALEALLGKPVAEANALFIPTGVYPFVNGPRHAWYPIGGAAAPRITQLGWKSMGILEPSVLPSIDQHIWLPALEEADALLVWGGDPLFISYWMQQSGLTALLPSFDKLVYVGVSAGSIATASLFAETYGAERCCAGEPLSAEQMHFTSPTGDFSCTFVTANGMGLTEFALIPHLEHKDHREASLANAAKWAARLPVPVYAIDDDSAVVVKDGVIEVVSEGQWKLFMPVISG